LKLLTLRMVNIKKHKDKLVDFNGETSMILGPNGCGKSTIVESLYYGLFRSLIVPNVNDMISEDIQIVSEAGKVKYTEKSFIELTIDHNDIKYKITSGLAKCNCSLKVFEDDAWVEKVNKITEMYAFIKNNILDGMTSDYFINTVYTEQMGILKLVGKNETARQQEFDKLVGIDRFQKVHAAVGVSFSKLNKLLRNDIDNVISDKVEKETRLKDELTKLESLNTELSNMFAKNETFKKRVSDLQTLIMSLEHIYQTMYNDYVSANDMSTKLNQLNEMKNKCDIELKSLNDSFNKSYVDQFNLITKRMGDDIVFINDGSRSLFSQTEEKKKELSKQIETLNKDLNAINQIVFIKKTIKETDNIIETSNNTILGEGKRLKDIIENITKISNQKTKQETIIQNKNKEVLKMNTFITSIEKYYKTSNFTGVEQSNIIQYFHNQYNGVLLEKDEYICANCNNVFIKGELLDKINDDKTEYLNIVNMIETLEDEIHELEITLSGINEELNSLIYDKNSIETKIQYSKNLRDESKNKLNSLHTSNVQLESEVTNKTLTQQDMINGLSTAQDELNKLNSDPKLTKLYPYYDGKRCETEDTYLIEDLLSRIEQHVTDKVEWETLHKKISEYKNGVADLEKRSNEYNTEIVNLFPKIQEILSRHNAIVLSNLYDNVMLKQEVISKNKISLGEVQAEQSTQSQLISNVSRQVNESKSMIDYLEKEIDKLQKIIDDNKVIQERIRMVNVAKAYFKHDGLAKHIRQFYIRKINENMINYIHLFGFEFTPEIDETAGIKNYHRYSGGQRIAIAILMKMIINFILKNPINMMILDEPTPYMDTERIEAIRDLIVSIKDKLQLIVITHDVEFMNIDCNKLTF